MYLLAIIGVCLYSSLMGGRDESGNMAWGSALEGRTDTSGCKLLDVPIKLAFAVAPSRHRGGLALRNDAAARRKLSVLGKRLHGFLAGE